MLRKITVISGMLAALTLSAGYANASFGPSTPDPVLTKQAADSSQLTRRGRGADDAPGDDRGGRGRGTDDGPNHTMIKQDGSFETARRGRGADDGPGHVRGGHGADDGPNHT